jgi:Family of unknown function (DUF5908)
MTIEIRELVIQARVTASEEIAPILPPRSRAQEKADEARWVEIITQQVLDKLREDGGWSR